MPRGTLPTRTSTWIAWGILIVVCLTLSFSYLGSYVTLGSHEVVAAVPGREMLHSGDWIIPRYGDVPRVRKPPLVYWLVASSGWLFGGFDDFVVRFHSAIAAIGMVALMGLWAYRWYGREAAFAAALIQTTSFWACHYERHVEIDMVQCLLTTAAMFLIANQPDAESSSKARLRWIGILSLIGLTWLAKFHYGTAMVFGPVFVFWTIQRAWRRWLNLVNPIGLLIVVACALIWPCLLLREYPEALERIRFETVGRAIGEIGYDPWWYFGPQLLLLALPWTGHVLLIAPQSWLRAWRHGDERERFLWVWLIVDVVIASLSPNKHVNYLLAAMPAMTLLAAQMSARIMARFHRGAVRLPKYFPVALAVGAVLLGMFLFGVCSRRFPASELVIRWGLAGATGGVLVSCWCLHRRYWSVAGWTSLASGLVVFLVAVSSVTPVADERREMVAFAHELRQEVLKERPVCVYARKGTLPGFHPSIYYLDEPVFQVSTFSELIQQVRRSGELLTVMERESLGKLRAVEEVVDFEEIAHMPSHDKPRDDSLVCVRLKYRSDDDRDAARVATQDVPAAHAATAKRR